ncbi:MAG: hypothetical protein AB1736_11525, partial [Chloroflexota bacterium]
MRRLSVVVAATIGLLVLATAGFASGLLVIPGAPTTAPVAAAPPTPPPGTTSTPASPAPTPTPTPTPAP